MPETTLSMPEPAAALKKALQALGSYGTISTATGYSRGYWCSIAQGRKKLTSRAVERLIIHFPQFISQLSQCPTCGQLLPQK